MGEKSILDEAYEKALKVIEECSTPDGLFASGGPKGYRGVWARDSMITLIGASSSKSAGSKLIKDQFKKSLVTLGKYQSEKGEIPNAILKFEQKKPQVDYLSIDSSLWFIIGSYMYKKRYRDGGHDFLKRNQKKIDKALLWLSYQDIGEDLMLEQHPTTDWQDAFPHRYGRTINTQALYYEALRLMSEKRRAEKLKDAVNYSEDSPLWNRHFYYAYRWKNHGKYKEVGDWFDSLGNIIAIIFDLTDEKRAQKIISYIRKKRINKPYPMKCIFPPITENSKYWKDYYKDCAAGEPYHYSNGGIWPYIGSFYVLALIKLEKFREAKKELIKLAEANIRGNFPEWINPLSKRNHGKLQAWNAGTYILAYESLNKRKVLI